MAERLDVAAEARELLGTPHFRYANLPFDLRVRALLEAVAGTAPGITLTREQLEAWAWHRLTDEQVEALAECIPNSSIPQAVQTILSEALDIHDPDEPDEPDDEEVDDATI